MIPPSPPIKISDFPFSSDRQAKGEGVKHDAGKLRWSLLPLWPMREILRVLEHGARKYSEENWKRILDPKTRYYDAAMRHITAWKSGESHDSDSRLHHLAHAACCLLFLLWFEIPKQLISQHEEKNKGGN